MTKNIEIEQLKISDKQELFELYNRVFTEYPFISLQKIVPEPDLRLEKLSEKFAEIFTKLSIDTFGVMQKKINYAYGIKIDNKLVCAIITYDSELTEKLSVIDLIKLSPFLILFIIRLLFYSFRLGSIVGNRTANEFGNFFHRASKKEKPKYKKYIEIGEFGTLPSYQKQGLGRKMLYFIINKTKKEGYRGMLLLTNPDNPAFHFYLKEGFVVEKEFTFKEIKLCWMRLDFEDFLPTAHNSG